LPNPQRSNPKIMHRAGELRQEPTPAEQKLWAYLRTLREDGPRFRRQHAIGSYTSLRSVQALSISARREGNSLSNWMAANI